MMMMGLMMGFLMCDLEGVYAFIGGLMLRMGMSWGEE